MNKNSTISPILNQYSVVDLFCGIGGLTHGFVKEKFNVVAGIDSDESCRYAYEKNNSSNFISKKIEEISKEDLENLYPVGSKKILIGCAPCQPFSSYTSKVEKDGKWGLLYEFARLVKELKPEIVSMENVPQIRNHEVYKDFIKTLDENDYKVTVEKVRCEKYGVPQKRTRLVLLASRLGEIKLMNKTHKDNNYKTVKNAIGNLPKIADGETCVNDKMHRARKLNEVNKKRILHSKPGGTWNDWPEELILECHKRPTGKTYKNIYGRMEWDKPSQTITTLCCGIGNGRFGHPEQDRAISIREAALLQSFPKSYKFVAPRQPVFFGKLGVHIGNAVPVKLGKVIAKSIKKHLEEKHGK